MPTHGGEVVRPAHGGQSAQGAFDAAVGLDVRRALADLDTFQCRLGGARDQLIAPVDRDPAELHGSAISRRQLRESRPRFRRAR